MQKVKYLILGAGMAGLGAALTLRKRSHQTLILEASSQVGGLNSSVSIRGCDFDYGPKLLLLDDSSTSQEILSYLPDGYDRYPVVERTYLSSYGLLGFPLQRYLSDLPIKERRLILEDLDKVRACPLKINSFKDWLVNGFGQNFCEKVMFPYEEKKWQVPLEKMDYQWALNRPIKVNYEEILEGSKRRLPPNRWYFYPKYGNISVLTQNMAKQAGQIQLNSPVIKIDLKNKIVITQDRAQFKFEYLISSLPLDDFIGMSEDLSLELRKLSKKYLKRVSIKVFNLVFEGDYDLEGTAIYFPEKKFPFRRVSVLKNICPPLAKAGLTSISVELSTAPRNQINDQQLLKIILNSLRSVPQFKQLKPLLDYGVLDIGFAYPLQLTGLKDAVNTLHAFYQGYGIYHCGRGGTFDYCNSDVAYKQGIEAANCLQSDDSPQPTN